MKAEEVKVTAKDVTPTVPLKSGKIDTKYLSDRDREMVKGIFRFFEVPGGSLNFVYRAYKEDKLERYDFIDGQIYTIPLGVARHLNKNLWYPIHDYMQDENGVRSMMVKQKVRRAAFQSLEFIDESDFRNSDKSIITVERTGLAGI